MEHGTTNNNFNRVFLTIKKHCEEKPFKPEKAIFETIAIDANVSLFLLQYYLDLLQNLGFIEYSFADNFLCLTSFGKRQAGIFVSWNSSYRYVFVY